MTDIIKLHEEIKSSEVKKYLRKHPEVEEENIKKFEQELIDIGSKNPILIALGNDSFNILNRNLKHKYKIYKVTHYSARINKETLRNEFLKIQKYMCQ